MSLRSAPMGPLRRAARLRFAVMHERRRFLLRPLDSPSVRAEGQDDPLRVLLVGNGLFHGWGVASHQLAPTGELARGIRTLARCAVDVEFVGDAAMSAETSVDWVASRADRSFHCAVVALGGSDALRLTPVARWSAQVAGLLNRVQAGLPDGAPVVLVGSPDVYVPGRIRPLHALAARHARRLDRAAARLADIRPDVHFLALPSFADLAGDDDVAGLYGRLTDPIAAAVVTAVREREIAVEPGGDAGPTLRPDVASAIEATRWDDLPELQRLVERAKAEFGVTESAVTLVDGDRTWHVAQNGSAPASVPRALTYCEAVVASGDSLVVPDAKRDLRFADNPFLDLVHARFYAGVPIHAADGTTVGAFCLLNGTARSADSVDLERLRDFAAEAELALHRITAEA